MQLFGLPKGGPHSQLKSIQKSGIDHDRSYDDQDPHDLGLVGLGIHVEKEIQIYLMATHTPQK